MKRYISTLLVVLLFIICITGQGALVTIESYADTEWPSQISIESDGGIVIDAESGAVLYGKNIHLQYFPASITKILTALIIVERCDLNEMVTFSHNAVYNVEEGSSNAGFDTGDNITVRDALYALLLKSANEAANALAEHCSGSVEEFAKLMNQRAREIGCTNSNFKNPSGLNDPEHYVTAYDYALIAREAFKNPLFVEIDSTRFYDLPACKRYPEGQTIYTHHAMLKRSNALYYPGIIGGKTGYTTLAGNTLVTCAERDGLKLITVILNGHKTHYTDTKVLMDFGFSSFKNVEIADIDIQFNSIMDNVHLVKSSMDSTILEVDTTRSISLPKNANVVDITKKVHYNLEAIDPVNAIAKIEYHYGERKIGHTYLLSHYGWDKYSISAKTQEQKDNIVNKEIQEESSKLEGNSEQEEIKEETVEPSSPSENISEVEEKNPEDTIAVKTGTLEEGSLAVVGTSETIKPEETMVENQEPDTTFVQNTIKVFKEFYPYLYYAIMIAIAIFILLVILKIGIVIYDKYELRKKRRLREERKKAMLEGKVQTTDVKDLDLASEDGKLRNRKWFKKL